MTNIIINDNIFFFLQKGKIIVWDYKNHAQFELPLDYFKKMIEIDSGETYLQDNMDPIIRELISNNIVIKNNQHTSIWNYDLLSKIFHIGTSDIIQTHNTDSAMGFAIDYLEYCSQLNNVPLIMNSQNFVKKKKLSICENFTFTYSDLKTCLYKRKTVRVFKEESVPLELLSTLLYYSFGYIHIEDSSDERQCAISKRKATPSGGNLHPTKAYVITKNVTELEDALYYYDSDNHALNTINECVTTDWIPKALLGQYFSQNANIHIFLTFNFSIGAWKYPHSRGYRAALLDVGHLSQTFQLISTALGLNTWITGAFEDSTINTILNIDVNNEAMLFYMCAGNSDGQSTPLEFVNILQQENI